MTFIIHVSVVLQREEAILLVQERKPENYELWNLPGGHLELGEILQEGAEREAAEETGLAITLTALVGVYTRYREPDYQAFRFVFTAQHTGDPVAGDDILAVRWFTPADLEALPDSALVGGERLRPVLADVASNRRYPLEVLKRPA